MVRTIGFVAALSFCAGGAMAEVLTFDFTLDGSQEVPKVDTPATGHGMVTLDTDSLLLSWDISYTDLLAPVSAAHFHAPAGIGEEASPVIDFASFGSLDSPIVGSQTITSAQRDEIIAGLWYANIHSTLHPGGEIRGQVIPAPAAALVGVGGILAIRRRR